MHRHYYRTLALFVAGIASVCVGGQVVLTQTVSCPLPVLIPYKTPESSSVYYISEDCKKRPIRSSQVYFSHFSSWKDVRLTSRSVLNRIPDHELSFLPWGPRRVYENGSLIKTVTDPKVYLLLENATLHPIESETVFRDVLGYQFNQIEDVTPAVIQKYAVQASISSVNTIPSGLIFKYPEDPKVYVSENSSSGSDVVKRYITSITEIRQSNYRVDRIAILPIIRLFPDATGSRPLPAPLPIPAPQPGPGGAQPGPQPVTPVPAPQPSAPAPSPTTPTPAPTTPPPQTPSPSPTTPPPPAPVTPVPPPAPLPTTAITSWPPTLPTELRLSVQENLGVARQGEVLRSGAPLPKTLNLRSTNNLAIVDSSGRAVPANFSVLARWNGSLSTSEPIKWLGVSFPVTVGARGNETYRLVTDGSVANAAPTSRVTVTQDGNRVTVRTGAAEFVVNGSGTGLFEQLRLADGTVVSEGGVMSAGVNGTTANVARLRSIRIESADTLSAVVSVESEYGHAAISGGGFSITRRYVFTAGSPTAQIRQTFAWEGDSGYQGYVRVNRVRDTLPLGSAATNVIVRGEAGRVATEGNPNGTEVSVVQARRANPTASRSYAVTFVGRSSSGVAADGAYLAARNARGTVAIAIGQMDKYEPQALRVQADGTIAIDIVNEETILGVRQGLFANIAVSVLPATASSVDIERQVFAPVNAPLHAWPSGQWFAASNAVPEFPYGQVGSPYATYNTIVPAVLQSTLTNAARFGLYGVTTYGSFPRNWVNPIYSDEIAQGGGPTSEPWDDIYWGTFWTDYHNSSKLAVVWAMQSGQTEYLDSVTGPAAWRSLYTQAMQCSPSDTYFYCGQWPAGYGGFRTDFNSSHAYLDNVFLYSYLFADESVAQRIARGANTMRGFICPGRVNGAGAACGPTVTKADPYVPLTGRVASQYANIFQFLGTSSRDGSYLEDWSSLLARGLTQHYVEASRNGQTYGFWALSGDVTGNTAPNVTNSTDQQWMLSLYDMEVLHNYQVETDDAALGVPAIRPSRVITNWARTLTDFGGGGVSAAPQGVWPNALYFRYSGNRIGGTLLAVEPNTGGSDPNVYDAGKADMVAVLARAAIWSGDSSITSLAQQMTQYVLGRIGAYPLGKEQGLFLARIPSAVALLSPLDWVGSSSPSPSPSPTPSPSPSPNPSPDPSPNPSPTPSPTPNPTPPSPSPSAATGLPESTYTLQSGEAVNLQDGFPFAPTYNFAWFFEHSIGQGTCNGTDFVQYDLYLLSPGSSAYTRVGGHTGPGNSSFSSGYSMTTDGCAKGRFLYNMPSSNPSGTYRVGLCITNTQNTNQRYCTSIPVVKP